MSKAVSTALFEAVDRAEDSRVQVCVTLPLLKLLFLASSFSSEEFVLA